LEQIGGVISLTFAESKTIH